MESWHLGRSHCHSLGPASRWLSNLTQHLNGLSPQTPRPTQNSRAERADAGSEARQASGPRGPDHRFALGCTTSKAGPHGSSPRHHGVRKDQATDRRGRRVIGRRIGHELAGIGQTKKPPSWRPSILGIQQHSDSPSQKRILVFWPIEPRHLMAAVKLQPRHCRRFVSVYFNLVT